MILGGLPLALIDRNESIEMLGKGLNLCLRGYDKIHSPEFLEERDRDKGLEI